MRFAALLLVAATGVPTAAVTAQASPIVPAPTAPEASNIVDVAGGCGRGFHPTYRGRCVPNRYSYGYDRGYYARGFYGGGYSRHGWDPSDHVANRLNRDQLMRGGY